MDYFDKILEESLQGNRKSFAILEKTAKAGNAGAQYYLALYYKKKYGEIDDSKYQYWLEKSRNNGYRPIPAGLSFLEQKQKPDWMPRQENRIVTHFWVLVFHALFFMVKGMLASPDNNYSVPEFRCVDESTESGISSSWKCMGLATMQKMWKDRQLPGKVIDITPNSVSDEFLLNVDLNDMDLLSIRGQEIKDWLMTKGCNDCKYVIFDDMNDVLQEQEAHFVWVDPAVGITKGNVAQAIRILNGGMKK